MNIIGIDLGTTFSGLAVLDSIGKPAIVPNADGERMTPSVVFFDPDETAKAEIGDEARKQMDLYPDRVIVEAKREMGTEKIYSIGSRSFTPTEISALILKRMLQDAEKIYGKIDEAVVTVPANFLETGRRATKDAGELAGLDKVTLIDEPVAAAMLYATTQSVTGTALIFDLGGGTFDVTIANIDETNVQVVNSNGDPKLGGKDFDRALSGIVNDEYHAKYGQAVFDDKPDFKMMRQAEDIKKTLSRKEMWKGVVMGPAGPGRLEISREQFENSISVFVGKIKSLVDLALAEAGMSEQDIDHVLLVGGSTRIPCIKALLKKRFGREPEECVNVDEAVALGAAIYAGLQVDPGRLNPLQRDVIDRVNLSNVAPANYGTIAIDGNRQRYNSIIIYKNAPIPCSKTIKYFTVTHGQTSVDCSVTQCTDDEKNPEWISTLAEELMSLPPNRPSGQIVEVTFSYTEDLMMACEFKDVASGVVTNFDVDPSHGDSNYRRSVEVDPDCDVSDFLVD